MKSKIVWIDVIRVVAMLLVVIGHGLYTSGQTKFGSYEFINEYGGNINYIHQFLSISVAFIYSFHMPLFMAVAGGCFAFSFGTRSVKDIVRVKAKRLLIPFCIAAIFVSIPIRLIFGSLASTENNLLLIIIHHFIFPYQIHLWFLYSLFLLFPIFYFLKPLHDKSKYHFWIFAVILSWIGNYIDYPLQGFLGIPGAMKFFLYFAAGFYSINFFLRHNPRWPIVLISIALQYCAFQLSFAEYLQPIGRSQTACIIMALWGCYNVTALCILLAKYKVLINSRIYRLFQKYNFELYLYSDPFNYIFLLFIFSISYIDFFGNPAHTLIVTIARISLGIIFALLIAKIIEVIPYLFKSKILAK